MHVPLELLDAVARGEAPQELLDEIEREHTLALCEVCQKNVSTHEARLRRPGLLSRREPRDRLERMRQRLERDELKRKAIEDTARGWVKEVVKLPPEDRRSKVSRAYVKFKGPLFCLMLLDEARRRIPGHPAEAESLADAALASNEKTAVYRPDPEIQAPGLAVRGNARRALGRLLDGEADLEEAQQLLDAPAVTDLDTPAEVFIYLGSLRKDQGRFEEAVQHLRRASQLYQLLRDRPMKAQVLLRLGAIHYARHEPRSAVAVTEEALRLLDSRSEPWLRAYAHYNLAFHLHTAGETARAETELAEHEELIQGASGQLANLLVWLRARIAWSRGDLDTARRLFTEARERALERGIAWDAGLVGLELGLVHLVRGRTAEAKRLALEAVKVFAEQKVERETRASLELLDAAARQDALTRDLFEAAIARLETDRRAGAR